MSLQLRSNLLLPSSPPLVIPKTVEELRSFISQWGQELMTPEETANFTRYSESTLATWRCRKTQALPYIKIGHGGIRYRRWDVLQWLNSRLVK
jgi:predicted DNA-binding transcriptional regulator AlpA